MFNPKYSFQHLPGEHDKSLRISKHAGAKGGRPRVFAFVDESDPAIVDKERARLWRNKQDESALRAKSLCGNTGKLGWFCEEKNGLKRAIQKYQNLCRALGLSKSNRGITGHDLRAHFANEMLLLRGVTPPLLGGDNTEPKEVVRQGVKSAIEALGHSRPGIATFYYGRLQVRQTPKSNEVAEPAKTESKCSVNLSD